MAIGQEEIGRRIRTARDDAGLTQRALAALIGVEDAQSVSRYERGITEVTTRRLERIAEATGKPMSYFVLETLGLSKDGGAAGDESEGWRQVLAAIEAQRKELRQLLLDISEQLSPAKTDTRRKQ